MEKGEKRKKIKLPNINVNSTTKSQVIIPYSRNEKKNSSTSMDMNIYDKRPIISSIKSNQYFKSLQMDYITDKNVLNNTKNLHNRIFQRRINYKMINDMLNKNFFEKEPQRELYDYNHISKTKMKIRNRRIFPNKFFNFINSFYSRNKFNYGYNPLMSNKGIYKSENQVTDRNLMKMLNKENVKVQKMQKYFDMDLVTRKKIYEPNLINNEKEIYNRVDLNNTRRFRNKSFDFNKVLIFNDELNGSIKSNGRFNNINNDQK